MAFRVGQEVWIIDEPAGSERNLDLPDWVRKCQVISADDQTVCVLASGFVGGVVRFVPVDDVFRTCALADAEAYQRMLLRRLNRPYIYR